jgi:pilus assembly protein CpaD
MKMRSPKYRTIRAGKAALMTLGATLLLAGCSSYDEIMADDYRPVSVQERYPIRVENARVKLGVATPTGKLKPDQVNGVIAFTNNAKTAGLSGITVKYPSGSKKGRATANEIAQIIAKQNVPRNQIHVESYAASPNAPVQLSFVRKVAITTECGDWSANLGFNYENEPYQNFGCAYQNNIAAMVSNPEDLETPRSMSPALAANRVQVMKVYFDNKTAGDYYTLDNVASSTGN